MGLLHRIWCALRALRREPASPESIVRTTLSAPIAAHRVEILGQHGIPARSASDPSSTFMGDGTLHRLIVLTRHAADAQRILNALWDAADIGTTDDP